MTTRLLSRTLPAAIFVLLALAPFSTARAQTTGDGRPSWWFGAFGGANINLFSGEIHDPSATVTNLAAPGGFTSGSGIGLALGALIEYATVEPFGGNLMVGYDNRSVTLDPVGSNQLTISPAYLSIEPNLRIAPFGRGLHVMVGPSVGINVAKGFEFTVADSTSTRTASGELTDLRSMILGGQVGIGYDIQLSSPGERAGVALTPFAQARFGQGMLDRHNSSDAIGMTTLRLGFQIKIGGNAPPVAIVGPIKPGDFSYEIRVPGLIAESRTLNETFPLRNYVFFEPGTTDLPARYARLTPAEAPGFSESRLMTPEPTTGAEVRSRAQMQVYYNALNVLGDRMRKSPGATIRLVGAANGDAAAGRQMAEAVKSYLVATFGLDAARIATEGQPMPPNRSGTGTSQGEDARMIAAENNRVTILGPDELLRPVNIVSVQEEPIENDVVISVPSNPDMDYWSVELTGPSGDVQTLGPYRDMTVARIPAKPLLGDAKEARFVARAVMTRRDGKDVVSGAREFRLVRADVGEQQRGLRFSILFEFDESKTVQTYENFLAQTVAPAIPNGSTVIIHGHTDVIGTPEYNSGLSQRRVEETQKILTRELTRAGKTVMFDTYGFGEDERRAPFGNALPENRFYNRTVVIEVL